MTQLGDPVECPSLPPWCTYRDEPSCLIASPVETRPRAPVKALAGLLAGRAAMDRRRFNQGESFAQFEVFHLRVL